MFMCCTLLALQWWPSVAAAVFVALVLAGVLLLPYLFEEIRKGKVELGPLRRLGPRGITRMGPQTPTGAGDNHPGRVGDPAPGQPDGQADPYSLSARRGAPPIKS
jgi:hypothetical protein